jgi:hypothetical protein
METQQPSIYILTSRGAEFCGARALHEYQFYLAIEDIDYSSIKAKHSQTNDIYKLFHSRMQDEFYAIAFRKSIFQSLKELQNEVDKWLRYCNNLRPHSANIEAGELRWKP